MSDTRDKIVQAAGMYSAAADECHTTMQYKRRAAKARALLMNEVVPEIESLQQEIERLRNWVSVEDELPIAPIGRVEILCEEEYIGQGMPKELIKMIRIADYSNEFCLQGESGYWRDDYGNRS